MPVRKNEKNGTWEARVAARHPVTKKPTNLCRIKIKTKAEAERMEKTMLRQLYAKFHEYQHPLWNEVAEEYTKTKTAEGQVSQRYLEEKALTVKKYTEKLWARKYVDQITTQEIRDLVLISPVNISDARKKEILKAIRHVFDYAVDKNYLSKSPVPKIKFTLNKKMHDVLSEKELKILLNEAKKRAHPFYYLLATAIYLGLRNGECYSLRWASVIFDRDLVHIRESYDRKAGHKDYTKAKYDRLVELPAPLRKILLELKEITGDQEYVLPRLKEWDTGRQAAVLREFLGVIGVKSVRFHDLRASWACLLMTKGVPAAQVQKMGGWTDMKTFQIYVRKAGIDIKGATKVLSCLDDSEDD